MEASTMTESQNKALNWYTPCLLIPKVANPRIPGPIPLFSILLLLIAKKREQSKAGMDAIAGIANFFLLPPSTFFALIKHRRPPEKEKGLNRPNINFMKNDFSFEMLFLKKIML